MNELMFENTGLFDRMDLRKRNDLKNKAPLGYNVAENASRVRGVYRPIRNLPVAFKRGNLTDFEGYVWTQGKFIGKYDIKTFVNNAGAVDLSYQNSPAKLGIKNNTTGVFSAFLNAKSGAVEDVAFDAPYWGNSADIEGLIGPFNGYSQDITEVYTLRDTEYNIIDPVSGALIDTAAIAGPLNATLRQAGDSDVTASSYRLAGVAISDTIRETRNNNYQYQRKTEAITLAKEGYLVLPFVVENSATLTLDAPNAVAPVNFNTIGSVQRDVSFDQTVMFVKDPALLISGADIKVDGWGNPILSADVEVLDRDEATIKLVDMQFAYDMPMGNEIEGFPGLEVAGNQTGGLEWSVWSLAKKVEAAAGRATDVDSIRTAVVGKNLYGYAVVYYNIA